MYKPCLHASMQRVEELGAQDLDVQGMLSCQLSSMTGMVHSTALPMQASRPGSFTITLHEGAHKGCLVSNVMLQGAR